MRNEELSHCLSEKSGISICSPRSETDLRQFRIDAGANDSFLGKRKPSQDGIWETKRKTIREEEQTSRTSEEGYMKATFRSTYWRWRWSCVGQEHCAVAGRLAGGSAHLVGCCSLVCSYQTHPSAASVPLLWETVPDWLPAMSGHYREHQNPDTPPPGSSGQIKTKKNLWHKFHSIGLNKIINTQFTLSQIRGFKCPCWSMFIWYLEFRSTVIQSRLSSFQSKTRSEVCSHVRWYFQQYTGSRSSSSSTRPCQSDYRAVLPPPCGSPGPGLLLRAPLHPLSLTGPRPQTCHRSPHPAAAGCKTVGGVLHLDWSSAADVNTEYNCCSCLTDDYWFVPKSATWWTAAQGFLGIIVKKFRQMKTDQWTWKKRSWTRSD